MVHKVLYITRDGVQVTVEIDTLVNYLVRRARHNRTKRARIAFATAKVVADNRSLDNETVRA